MKTFWSLLGRGVFWITYPALWLVLRGSHRTRLLIINDNAELLVVKGWLSGSSKWNLPGGGLHTSEAIISGAIRELREETGLELAASKLRQLTTQPYRSRGITTRLTYLTATVAGRPLLHAQRFEILEAAWIPIAELTAKTAEPDVLLPLERWLESADFATM